MTLEDVKYLSPFVDVAQCLVLVALWLRKPGQDAGAKAAAAQASADAVASRLSVIEERLNHMPSEAKLTELEGDFKAMSATLEALQQNQDIVRSTVQRIEQYLLNNRA